MGGKRGSSQRYTIGLELRHEVTALEARERATAFAFQIEAPASDIRMAIGAGKLLVHTESGALETALKNYLAPGALNDMYLDLAQFTNFRKSARPVGA